MDETGKHEQAEVITIAGIAAPAREWKRLQKTRWAKAMRGFSTPYHHTDVLQQQKKDLAAGDEAGAKEYDELQCRLIDALSDIEYFGFGASLVRKEWDVFKARVHRDEKYQDPWFLVFETAISEIMHRTEDKFGITAPISIIFDRQDEFSERAHSIYNQTLAMDLPYRRRLCGLSFESKEKAPPLQAADLFVYEYNLYSREVRIKETGPPRWQWERIYTGRQKGAINGQIWRNGTLERLAALREVNAAE